MLKSEGWNAVAETSGLSQGLQLMLGDVAVGAKTPVMVSKVMAWRQKVIDTGNLEDSAWGRLEKLNEAVMKKFKELEEAAQSDKEYASTVRKISNFWCYAKLSLQMAKHGILRHSEVYSSANYLIAHPTLEWEQQGLGEILQKLRSQFILVRKQLKIMGEESGADIEPDSQTKLADATMELPGVLISGVPGGTTYYLVSFTSSLTLNPAGGMDGLFAIVIGEQAQECVRSFWTENGVNPLLLKEDKRGTLAHDASVFGHKRSQLGK